MIPLDMAKFNDTNTVVARGERWVIFRDDERTVDRVSELDPSVTLTFDDPRVGKVAIWDIEDQLRARIVAIINIDGEPAEFLMCDRFGYPWVRRGLDIPVLP